MTGGSRARRPVIAVAVAAVAVIATGACSGGRGVAAGEARLLPTGAVYVQTAAARPRLVRGARTLHSGDRVQVREGGAATMELSARRALELRPGSSVEVRTQPVLLNGDLLVTAPRPALTVLVAGSAARVAGAAHLSREPVVLASYDGTIDVDSAGRTMTVHGLRQTSIAAPGLLPPREAPLDYHELDPWDRRFLGDAISLGLELDSRSRTISAELTPAGGAGADFYRSLLPGLANTPFDDELLGSVQPGRTVGEMLVGAAIASAGHDHDFVTRWRAVFDFRDAGARWGLVARDQHVARVPLLSAVDEALGRAQPAIAAPAAPTAPSGVSVPVLPSLGEGPTPSPGSSRTPSPNASPTTTTPRPSSGPTPPTTTTVLAPPPTTGTPLDQPASNTVATLNNLLGPLVGGVPLPPKPSALPTSLLGPLWPSAL